MFINQQAFKSLRTYKLWLRKLVKRCIITDLHGVHGCGCSHATLGISNSSKDIVVYAKL